MNQPPQGQIFRNVEAGAPSSTGTSFPPAGSFTCVTGTFSSGGLGIGPGIIGFVTTNGNSVGVRVDLSNLNPLSLLLTTRQIALLNGQVVMACGVSEGNTDPSNLVLRSANIPTLASGAPAQISPSVNLGGLIGLAPGFTGLPGLPAATAPLFGPQTGINLIPPLPGFFGI